jgi:hypothetical protein
VVYEREKVRLARLTALEAKAKVFDRKHPQVGASETDSSSIRSGAIESIE